MAIPAANIPTPLEQPHDSIQFTDREGRLTDYALQLLESFRDHVNAGNRVIPCVGVATANLYTLTPNDASPLLGGYMDYEVFIFKADRTSDGVVTATVVPKVGALSTLKVYKSNGATQATTGDVVINSVYMLIFADHLDSAAGGFVLK